jgi:hypothetical protein
MRTEPPMAKTRAPLLFAARVRPRNRGEAPTRNWALPSRECTRPQAGPRRPGITKSARGCAATPQVCQSRRCPTLTAREVRSPQLSGPHPPLRHGWCPPGADVAIVVAARFRLVPAKKESRLVGAAAHHHRRSERPGCGRRRAPKRPTRMPPRSWRRPNRSKPILRPRTPRSASS